MTSGHKSLVSVLGAIFVCSAACGAPSATPSAERSGRAAQAVTGSFQWKGFTWTPTQGGMAGLAAGDPANVSVDANGYLHLKITKTGTTWTAAEVFTSTSLGFGTYQWQIAGPIDRMDHTVVLGLYPYGPAAGIGADGTNEIDTEFSYWNDELAKDINFDWGVYPPAASGTHWEKDLPFSLSDGNETTARLVWTKDGITGTLLKGIQLLASTTDVLLTQDYKPANPTVDVPQVAMPLGMNLWCYNGFPSSGRDVDIVIQDFQFVPEGQPIPSDDGGTSPAQDAGREADGAARPAPPADSGDAPESDASTGNSSGGTGTGGASGSGGGSGDGNGVESGSATGTSSGCAASPVRSDSGPFGVTTILALAALVTARRSRARRAS